MDQHQDNGQHSGQAVNVIGQSAHHCKHQPGAPGIEDDAKPEKNQVPDLEPGGEALAPYANGVTYQCQADDTHAKGFIHGAVLLVRMNPKK